MKPTLLLLLPLVAGPLAVAHEDHDHDKKEHAHHDGDDHDHDEEAKKGPHGGRIVSTVTPAFEVSVTADRKVRITFLDAENRPVAPAAQTLSGVSGDRADPTRLAFSKGEGDEAGGLVSDKPLPAGEHVPLILQIKTGPDAKTVTERLTLHLHD